MTSKPARPRLTSGMPDQQAPSPGSSGGPRVRDRDVTAATFGYLGAIFLGPVIPLIIYLSVARRSPVARYHAATAVNLSLTFLLYAVCCAILGSLLALDNITVALILGLGLIFLFWVSMLRYLIRGVIAARRGEKNEIPGWICARIVS
jgi:uncharacterized Tic20 family protein